MDKLSQFMDKARGIVKYAAIVIIFIKTIEFFFEQYDKEFKNKPTDEKATKITSGLGLGGNNTAPDDEEQDT